MRRVRIAELKDHLSEYLRVAQAGTRVIVLDRNQPIAELGPIAASAGADRDHRADLIRRGILLPASHRAAPARALGPLIPCRGDALAALRADRDES